MWTKIDNNLKLNSIKGIPLKTPIPIETMFNKELGVYSMSCEEFGVWVNGETIEESLNVFKEMIFEVFQWAFFDFKMSPPQKESKKKFLKYMYNHLTTTPKINTIIFKHEDGNTEVNFNNLREEDKETINDILLEHYNAAEKTKQL